MGAYSPSLGIDFGTTNSSIAWYNPRTGQAEVILNAEGEAKTPSVVYFGEDETLVGKPAEEYLEDVSRDRETREDHFLRTVMSIKRDLVAPPVIPIPDGRFIRPVEVAAEIIKKLKRDAEKGHFHKEVARVIITHPAEFNVIQQQIIKDAGRLAGFREVVLLEEPVAGALAYSRAQLDVGNHVLVYDLGGGTFDLAVLDKDGESFRVALEPEGIERCGGDDFDMALYWHCDRLAREKYGRPISPTATVDLKFRKLCRLRKENLTLQERRRVSDYLASDNGSVRFEHEIDRATFERLIAPYVEQTVRLTSLIVKEAEDKGHEVDSVVLTGGSSRVPLVQRKLKETLPVRPLEFDKKDVAVALGAAHFTSVKWPPPPPPPPRFERYRKEVEKVWTDMKLDVREAERLGDSAKTLGLSAEDAEEIEREVMGDTKEGILLEQYRLAVEMVWADGKLDKLEMRWLDARVEKLGLDYELSSRAESEVMGDTKEAVFDRQDPAPKRTSGLGDFDLAHALEGHAGEVWSVAFSPDGRFLVSGGTDNAIRHWNADTGQSVGTLEGHAGEVSSVAFSPDGRLLFSGSFDETVKVWQLPSGELLRTLEHPEWVWSVAVSPDGKLLASGSNEEIKLWDPESGELHRSLEKHSHWVSSVTISADGRFLFSGGADAAVKVWQLPRGELLRTLEHPEWVWSVAVSPDGKLLASGSNEGAVRIWDLTTGELVWATEGHAGAVLSVAVSPDGQLLLSGGHDGKIKVWKLETGEPLNAITAHPQGVSSIAISPDGHLLASGGRDHTVKLWSKEGTHPSRPGPVPPPPPPSQEVVLPRPNKSQPPTERPRDLPPDLPD